MEEQKAAPEGNGLGQSTGDAEHRLAPEPTLKPGELPEPNVQSGMAGAARPPPITLPAEMLKAGPNTAGITPGDLWSTLPSPGIMTLDSLLSNRGGPVSPLGSSLPLFPGTTTSGQGLGGAGGAAGGKGGLGALTPSLLSPQGLWNDAAAPNKPAGPAFPGMLTLADLTERLDEYDAEATVGAIADNILKGKANSAPAIAKPLHSSVQPPAQGNLAFPPGNIYKHLRHDPATQTYQVVLTDSVGSRVLAEYSNELEAIVALELISPMPSMQQQAAAMAPATGALHRTVTTNMGLASPGQFGPSMLLPSPAWGAKGEIHASMDSLAGFFFANDSNPQPTAQQAANMLKNSVASSDEAMAAYLATLAGPTDVRGPNIMTDPMHNSNLATKMMMGGRPMGKPPRSDSLASNRGTPVKGLVGSGMNGFGSPGFEYDNYSSGSMPAPGSGRKRQRNSGGGNSDYDDHKTSKYRGVVWDAEVQKWRAQLNDGGRYTLVGHYIAQDEAARAYDLAVIQNGRKDRTNFPPTMYRGGNPPQFVSGNGKRSGSMRVTSQYKGVSWNSACSKWVAVLWDRELKRARHIGSFESEEDAARAYDREALKMLGSEAGLNFRESITDIGTGGNTSSGGAAEPKGGSQYRGVSWSERAHRWEVRVWGAGKQHFVGAYQTEVEAARAYDKAIIKLRGADARVRSRMNFPITEYNLAEVEAEPLVLMGVGRGGSSGPVMSGAASGQSEESTREERPARRARHNRRHHDEGSEMDDEEVNHPAAARGPGAATQASRAASEHTAAMTGAFPHDMSLPLGLSLPFKQEGLQLQPPVGMGLSVMDQSAQLDMKFGNGLQANTNKPAPAFGLQVRPVLNLAASDSSGASEDASQPPQASQPTPAPLQQPFQLQTTPEIQALLAMSAANFPAGGMQPPLPLGMANLANGMPGFKPSMAGGAVEGLPEPSYQDGLDLSQMGGNGSGKGRGLTAPSAAAVPGQRGKSSYRGVSWCEKVKKWRALLWDGQKQRFLGHFVTDIEAARAYDRAVLDLRGPEGKTNFPVAMYSMEDQSSQQFQTKLPVSCFKGVVYNVALQKWEAMVMHNGHVLRLGASTEEFQAARAYDCALLHLGAPLTELNIGPENYPPAERAEIGKQLDAVLAEVRSTNGTGLTLANSMSATATVLRALDTSDHSSVHAAAMQTSLAQTLMSKGLLGVGKDSADNRDQGRLKKALDLESKASEVAQDQQQPKDQGPQQEQQQQHQLVSLLAQMPVTEVQDSRQEQVEDNQIGPDLFMPAPCHAQLLPVQPAVPAAGGLEAAASVNQPASQWRGVSFHDGDQKWISRARLGGRTLHLGSYSDEIMAAKAYDAAVIMVKGQRAHTNFPITGYLDPSSGGLHADALAVLRGGRSRPNPLVLPSAAVTGAALSQLHLSSPAGSTAWPYTPTAAARDDSPEGDDVDEEAASALLDLLCSRS